MRTPSDIERQIRTTTLNLESYEKQGLTQDAARVRGDLARLNAELQRANAEAVARATTDAQRNADAAAERRNQEQIAAINAAAKAQAEAEMEAARIKAEAIRDAERARREAEIDAERKRYCARLSDEELIKLKGAVNNDSFLKMKNTVQRELAEKKAIVNEACKYQKKGQELSKRGDVLCELITPKRNISIIIVVGVIAGILGIILAVALGKLILDNTPSLWESYQNYGTVINYQVSKRTQLLTKLAVFVPVILIPTIAAWIYSNRDYKKKVDRIPKTREELKIISEQIAENNSIVDALCKAEEEFTFTYDPAKCADIIKEISWKAKYAEEEYNNRHYTEKSVESLIDGLKVAGSDKSSQNEILKSNSNLSGYNDEQEVKKEIEELVKSIVERAKLENEKKDQNSPCKTFVREHSNSTLDLSKEVDIVHEENATVSQPVDKNIGVQNAIRSDDYTKEVAVPQKKGNKKAALIIVIAAVVVCAAVAVGVFFIFGNRSVEINLVNMATEPTFEGYDGDGYLVEEPYVNEKAKERVLSEISDTDRRSGIEYFFSTVQYSLDSTEYLCNGDEIRMYASYDKKLAEDLDLDVKGISSTITVNGLEEEDYYEDKIDSQDDGDYILPYSDSEYLTKEDVKSLSYDELQYAINEIYARHGRIFTDDDVKTYFNEKAWYSGTKKEVSMDELNEYEKANIEMLTSEREERDSY